ncbi:MAG TPA: SH3 domain-containing protein [Burkholderiales bacterium]|nr:SH3 domain-containing protein [Burkholderiales bacterium]
MRVRRMSAALATLFVALSSTCLLAQESGSALKADELRAEPFADAKTLGKINKGDALTILNRQGGWYQVKVSSQTGWVRMLSVRRGQGGQRDVGQEIGAVAGVATGRAGTGQVVSTTGVRGLSEEDLKHAKFNANEIAKAEANAVSAEEGKAFAAKAQLESRSLSFLPDPKGARQ